jgi:hypothetical protein
MAYDNESKDEAAIRQIHDEALGFRLSGGDVLEMEEGLRDAAAENAQTIATNSKRVKLDENGLTQGMRKHAAQPVLRRLTDGWMPLRAKFYNAIKPLQDKIQAYQRLEAEIEELEAQKRHADETIRQEYEDKPRWSDARDEYESAKSNHDKVKRAQGGRSASQWPLAVYILMLLIVGAAEIWINYETLLSFFQIPMAALGSTVVIALVFAFAAHEAGTIFKRHEHYFGPDIEKRKKVWKLGYFIFSHAIFLAMLGAIGFFRYTMILDNAPSGGGPLGGEGAGPGLLQEVGVSLVFNLGVYAAGAMVAYLRHDPHPPLVDAENRLAKARRRFEKQDKARRELLKQRVASLDRQIQEKRNTAEQDYKDVQAVARMQQAVEHQHQQLVQDARRRINDAIQTYQYGLVQNLRGQNIAVDNGSEEMDLDAFANCEVDYPESKIHSALGT